MLSALELSPGTVLGGDFRVLRRLGAGGMGVVYVAEQLSTGSLRALKLLRPAKSDSGRADRFVNEAKFAARIKSDHVVQVVGAGRDAETGLLWLAMELLEGESLDAHVARKGKLSAAALRLVMGQLCHALAAAHAAGIVHRDIKPENVFLAVPRREGTSFTLKLLDLGIAKAITASSRTVPLGTPIWMAPEQADIDGKISPATDVWSLGLLAFYMLTGRVFWESVNRAATAGALMKEVLIEPIPPASERARGLGCGADLPAGFDGWFARCLERDPAARFSDAAEARARLDACLEAAGGKAEVDVMPDSIAVIGHEPADGDASTVIPNTTTQAGILAVDEPRLERTAEAERAREGQGEAPARRRPLWVAAPLVLGAALLLGYWVSRPAPAARELAASASTSTGAGASTSLRVDVRALTAGTAYAGRGLSSFVEQQSGKLGVCSRDGGLWADVTLLVPVLSSGKVFGAPLDLDEGVRTASLAGDAPLRACLLAEIASWSFPPHAKTTDVAGVLLVLGLRPSNAPRATSPTDAGVQQLAGTYDTIFLHSESKSRFPVPVVLEQEGARVVGDYREGTLACNVDERGLSCVWLQTNDGGRAALARKGRDDLVGTWGYVASDSNGGPWTFKRRK